MERQEHQEPAERVTALGLLGRSKAVSRYACHRTPNLSPTPRAENPSWIAILGFARFARCTPGFMLSCAPRTYRSRKSGRPTVEEINAGLPADTGTPYLPTARSISIIISTQHRSSSREIEFVESLLCKVRLKSISSFERELCDMENRRRSKRRLVPTPKLSPPG